jgi:hypothetical protein
MKTANDVLTNIKGAGNAATTLTGKGSFSKQGFGDLTSALVNDTGFKVKTLGKDGKLVETSISDLLRNDLKKTIANAKYPQKSEAGVLDTCDIATSGLAEAIPLIVSEQIRCGKKFDLPATQEMVGSIYLHPVEGKVKEVKVRDIKTKADMGTAIITTKDSVQVRAKSPVPKHLQTKIRKDTAGNVIKK